MKEQDEIFRATIRFNRVEYSDLDKDLSRFSGTNKGARIRMLLRLGLQCETRLVLTEHPHLAPVGRPHGHKNSEPTTAMSSQPIKYPVDTADTLANMGFDPTNFQFGGGNR